MQKEACVYHDVIFCRLSRTKNMALEAEKDCKEITQRSGNADYDNLYERVRKFLRPLEKRWDYVQSVLLWKKPTHSLGYFIAMTSIFR